ncbi:MAG: dihydrolipoyl dehydrogenase [Deltaproteobacteria bacterium]|nr:MAG: dihydrolipoyl dehydrogenase [Deltaproteobacteria bacterium]
MLYLRGSRAVVYEVAILGGGPGGYVGAIRGGQLGLKVCLIEKGELGGACLNRGCIPSKAFYASAERMKMLADAEEFGINAGAPTFDLTKCVERKDEVVDELVGGVAQLLKANGVEVIKGTGVLDGPEEIVVETESGKKRIEARSIIIATGSTPILIPSIPVDGEKIVTTDDIWALSDLPERLVIVGGGVIGCELAHIFSSFGSKVTVVEMLDRILSTEDKEASRTVQKALTKQGVEFMTGVKVASAVAKDETVTVTIEGGEEIVCDRVVVSIGRKPVSSGIGLKDAGIKTDKRGFIEVSDAMETSVPGVYAVGDVVGKYMLAHVATNEALVAMHNTIGKKYWMDYTTTPRATFTSPEVSSVGLLESQLKEAGTPYKVGRFAFAASGKAVCMGEKEGFVKLLSSADTGRILGGTIVGVGAAELVAELALAIRVEASPGDIVTTIHAHPTLSEVILEASEDTMGLAIHKAGRKRREKKD